MSSYLTKRGYVLLKEGVTEAQDRQIREELTARPFVQTSYGAREDPYAVFLENKRKFYLPPFAGRRMFGEPEGESKVGPGEDISLEFAGQLRDFQREPVETMLTAVREKGGGILSLPGGKGKCMARGSMLLMADGSEKAIELIEPGDQLMGDDSCPRTVQTVCQGRAPMYHVDAPWIESAIEVNGDHILCLSRKGGSPLCGLSTGGGTTSAVSTGGGTVSTGGVPEVLEISVEDYLKLPAEEAGQWGAYRAQVMYQERPLMVEPYMVGHWLGGGGGPLFATATHKRSIIEFYGLATRSHIPDDFRFNTVRVRAGLLGGLVDTRGFHRPGEFVMGFNSNNTGLVHEVTRLAQSIGLAVVQERYAGFVQARAQYHEFGFARLRDMFLRGVEVVVLRISGPGLWRIHSYIEREPETADVSWSPIKVTERGEGDYFGFTLDGNGRYLMADALVTHNTVMGLKLIQELGKKCLVIVHKEFLVNQWHERIRQFLPGARVGLIQAETINIDDKDIVIGMLQSLSMKEYPMDLFDSFGTVVIDECHRIPCRVFSQALFKINSRYMIGLTATPSRSDGLFDVLTWFVGNIEYALKEDTSSNSRNVSVKRLVYNRESNGRGEYQREQMNAMGKLNDQAMLSALCEFRPRTEAICGWVWQEAVGGRRTLILSERIQHLNDMEEILVERLKGLFDFGAVWEFLGQFEPDWERMEGEAGRKKIPFSPQPVTDLRMRVQRLLDASVFRRGQNLAHGLVEQTEDEMCLEVAPVWQGLERDLTKYAESLLLLAMVEAIPVTCQDPFEGEPLLKRRRKVKALADTPANREVKKMYATLEKRRTAEKEVTRTENAVRYSLAEWVKVQCYEALLSRNIEPGLRVGYYIGGMSEQALKESEECEIILGTYQMASEGLDIQALNTLFLATPKGSTSNVFKQATWRIMRKEHRDYPPLIIDFVDLHSKYRAQADKRRGYFSARKYDITNYELNLDGSLASPPTKPPPKKKKPVKKEEGPAINPFARRLKPASS